MNKEYILNHWIDEPKRDWFQYFAEPMNDEWMNQSTMNGWTNKRWIDEPIKDLTNETTTQTQNDFNTSLNPSKIEPMSPWTNQRLNQ